MTRRAIVSWIPVVMIILFCGALAVSGWRPAVPPAIAQPARVWEVVAPGALAEEQLVLNVFSPNPLTIAVGDSVRWTVEDGHTVTFLAGRPAPPQFVAGGPIPEGRIAAAGFSPIGPEGAYDGSDVRSSGRPVSREDETYTLTFTAPGVYPYVCLVHPGMNGSITVLPAGAALPETPAQAQARGQAERTALLEALRAGVQSVRLASAPAAGGTRTHSVAAGVAHGAGASALHFIPGELALQRGDSVVWVVADPFEPHTITFTSGAPMPEFVELLADPGGMPLFVQRPQAYRPVGGTRYTGAGYLNSGQLFGGVRGPLAFVVQIDAPPGVYEYACLIHREMKATIVVSE